MAIHNEPNNKEKSAGFLTVFCQILRILTLPALLACLLALFLFLENREIAWYEFALLALFDGIIPILSYPVCFLVPKWRKEGRRAQRKAAFVFSAAGYAGGVVYALIARVPKVLLVAYLSYACSVILLILFNKAAKLKASGHACGIAGPLTLLVTLCGLAYLPACLCVAAAVVFSSLYLKRHTAKELLFGALSSMLPVVILWLCFFVFFS